MKIDKIKTVAVGTHVEVVGKITKVFAPKSHSGQYGDFTSQGFVIEDETGNILINMYDKTIPESFKNTQVTLSNCVLRIYEKDGKSNFVLDMKKGSEIFSETVTPNVNTDSTIKTDINPIIIPEKLTVVKDKKNFEELMFESALEIRNVVMDNNWKKMWFDMTGKHEMTSEDVRSFIISNIISKQRG